MYAQCTVYLCTGTGECMHSVLYIYVQVLENVCTVYCIFIYRYWRMYAQCTVNLCTGTGEYMYSVLCTVYLYTGTKKYMYSVMYVYVQELENICTVYCIFIYRYWRMYAQCTEYLYTGTVECMHSVLYIYVQVLENVCTIYLCKGTGSCNGGWRMELELLQLSSLYWRQG